MASSQLSFDEIHKYFIEKGGRVSNKELVTHFKKYLTHQDSKDDARQKFKKYINILASSKNDGVEKYLVLRSKHAEIPGNSPSSPVTLPQNTVGIPSSGSDASFEITSPVKSPEQRMKPPPYRPPPPVTSPTSSLDNVSINSSCLSLRDSDDPPQAPPRRRSVEKSNRMSSVEAEDPQPESTEQAISVKERTQKFNRLASVDNELSPQPQKDKRRQAETGADEDDGASVTSLDPKKTEWVVAAARGDYQALAKLAAANPRLAKTRCPFTGYTALHWAAKHGNTDIIKLVAGTYHADPNARTNGGYTPLHIAMCFNQLDVFKLLVEVYDANKDVRDWSGKKPMQYLNKDQTTQKTESYRHMKSRKKTSEKDLGFLRIGSLNVRVKKTTEAFSNFLGVGNSGSGFLDSVDRVQKSWGSADNISKEEMLAPKNLPPNKRKLKYYEDITLSHSTPASPNQKRSIAQSIRQDSDSDIACGFDSNWKH